MSSKNARQTLNHKQVKAITKDQWEQKYGELVIVNLTNFFTTPSLHPQTLLFNKFTSILLDAIYAMKINYGPRPEAPI